MDDDYSSLRSLIRSQAEQVGVGCDPEEVDIVRSMFASLPPPYAAFLRDFGWFTVSTHEVIGFGRDVPRHLNLLEVVRWEREEAEPALPPGLLPLENNGAGDHYCLDVSATTAPVVFWSHDDPRGSAQDPLLVCSSFVGWAVGLFTDLARHEDQ